MTAKFTKDSFQKAFAKDSVALSTQQVKCMKVNGKTTQPTVLVCTQTQQKAIDTRASGLMTNLTGRELKPGSITIADLMVTSCSTQSRARATFLGKTVATTKGISLATLSTARVSTTSPNKK